MEIDLSQPRVVSGKVMRRAWISEETPDGLGQTIEVNVWVEPSDSITELSARTREATAALLQRAIDALRAT